MGKGLTSQNFRWTEDQWLLQNLMKSTYGKELHPCLMTSEQGFGIAS